MIEIQQGDGWRTIEEKALSGVYVFSVEAIRLDGEATMGLAERFPGLPYPSCIRKDYGPVFYFGDMAKFIVANWR